MMLPKYNGPGVYCITNTANGKVYVGSSTSIRGRLLNHRGHLRRGVHDNEILQRAWNKWGELRFRFDVLEECEAGQVRVKEQYWIDCLKSLDKDKGYNICLFTADAPMTGRRHSEESRKKMSESWKESGRDISIATEAASKANRGRKSKPETILKRRRTQMSKSKAEKDHEFRCRSLGKRFGKNWRKILGIPAKVRK